jgi:hypothetical protein
MGKMFSHLFAISIYNLLNLKEKWNEEVLGLKFEKTHVLSIFFRLLRVVRYSLIRF